MDIYELQHRFYSFECFEWARVPFYTPSEAISLKHRGHTKFYHFSIVLVNLTEINFSTVGIFQKFDEF